MKGISLLQDSIMVISTLALVTIMALFVWGLVATFETMDKILPEGMPTTRSVEMSLYIKPARYESMMSAFLESEYNGVKMKDVLYAVAIQRSTDVWFGQDIDASYAAHAFFDSRINRYYILKIDDIIIAEEGTLLTSGSPTGLQRVSVDMFLLNGEKSYLQLFVAD
jgi:hypothetical protein